MKKEEILEASRNENKNKDYAEIENENRAIKYGAIGIIILSTVYFCLEIFIKGETNYGFYSIIALYSAIVYGYKAIKDKRKINIINSIIWLIVAVILIIQYINNIFATSKIL